MADGEQELQRHEALMRSVDEWVGKTDDSPVPPRVRLRVFERHGGICHISGRQIRPGEKWEVEHVVALANGGSHCESNLAPALVGPHRQKTAQDRKIKAKNDRIRKVRLGIRGKSKLPGGRDSPFKKKMNGTVVRRDEE
jgi:5-methylcytosine-specific restriction protein A